MSTNTFITVTLIACNELYVSVNVYVRLIWGGNSSYKHIVDSNNTKLPPSFMGGRTYYELTQSVMREYM